MNPEILEERVDFQVGINIIEHCLKQIRTYDDFVNRIAKLRKFIEEKYPNKIKELDIKVIIEIISRWMEQDLHIRGYRGREPMGMPNEGANHNHPYIFGINDQMISELLKTIISNEKNYLISLSEIYSKSIPLQ